MGIASLMPVLAERVRQRRAELIAVEGNTMRNRAPIVGYFSNYAPRELIAACGAIPLRLADGGTYVSKTRGERYVRSDACPFCKSGLDLFAADPLYRRVNVVIGASPCDQLRRLPEVIHNHFAIAVWPLALPRTRADDSTRAMLRHEYDWLRAELENLTGVKLETDRLRAVILEEEEKRRLLNSINEMRRAPAPRVREQDILRLVTAANILPTREFNALVEQEMARIDDVPAWNRPEVPKRIMICGSTVAEQDLDLVQMIEERAAIVTDLLDTGVRSFIDRLVVPESGDAPELVNRLADFYFDQPHIQQRPNDAFYALARRLAADLRVQAVVLKTLLYCDAYSFEAGRLERELGLPLLHIDTDYGEGNREQVLTRVEAFLETLQR
jgi:benzoyl-CoA reductase/2-hydroxyglutaryl-CoA dehydratase subunit BcrC/BadD/HgdB